MARRPPGASAPDGYDIRDFPPFAVTVDVVVLTVLGRDLHVVLIRRHGEPYAGSWALPGGFKRPDETLHDAAGASSARRRESPRPAGWGSSERTATRGGTRGAASSASPSWPSGPTSPIWSPAPTQPDARLWRVSEVVDGTVPLAFDHHRILLDALDHAADRLQHSDLATAFVGPTFTLTELRSVYEAVWGESLDAANFRRSMAIDAAAPYAEPSGSLAAPGPEGGRPPERFRATESWTSGSPVKRPRRRPDAKRPPDR